jgi:hypothetical protein
MTKMNLSYVLGPSIIGNSANNISSVQIIHEIKIHHQIVENLISLPSQYYENIMSINDAKLLKNAPNTLEILRKSRIATVSKIRKINSHAGNRTRAICVKCRNPNH